MARDHTLLAGWVNFLWLIYPIAFGISDGGNTIGVTPGAIFFGVLDVLLAPVVAFGFLVFARNWDYGRLNLGKQSKASVCQMQGRVGVIDNG